MYNTSEPIRDGSQNQVNWKFGELLLGVRGEQSIPVRIIRFFQSTAVSIAHKHNWFHRDGIEEWKSVANETLAVQIRRFAALNQDEISSQRHSNRFAYMYTAIMNRMIDEIRRLARRSWEVPLPLDELALAALADPAPHTDAVLQRQETRGVISKARLHFRGDRVVLEILSSLNGFLDDQDDVRNYRARLVEHLATTLDITPQHARRHLRAFRERARIDETLKELVIALRGTQSLAEPRLFGPTRMFTERDELEGELGE